ncbi:cytochrome P450 3A25 [Trichonephila clavipes]|nr:cytochrome P450 3A25 [Trichonephila clavipes]
MPLHEVECERYNKLGRIYGHFEGKRALLSIGDPTLLREILVKDFQFFTGRRVFDTGDKVINKMLSVIRGEDWKRVRTVVTPTFTTGKIKRMLNIFKECSNTLTNNFQTLAEAGKAIDAKRCMNSATIAKGCSCEHVVGVVQLKTRLVEGLMPGSICQR